MLYIIKSSKMVEHIFKNYNYYLLANVSLLITISTLVKSCLSDLTCTIASRLVR